MMELGFGALLEKIEEHLGRRVLKVFLILIVGAFSLFCAKIIWDIAIGPVVRTASNLGFFEAAIYVAWLTVGWVFGGAITALIAGSFVRWKEARAYKEALHRAHSLIEEAREHRAKQTEDINVMLTRTRALMEETREMHDHSQRIYRALKEASEKKSKPDQP